MDVAPDYGSRSGNEAPLASSELTAFSAPPMASTSVSFVRAAILAENVLDLSRRLPYLVSLFSVVS